MRMRLLVAAAICAAFFVPASASAGLTMCDIDPSQRTVNVPCRVDSDGVPVGWVFEEDVHTVRIDDRCGGFNEPPHIACEGGVTFGWRDGVVGLDSFCLGWGAGACSNVDPGTPPTLVFNVDRPVAVCFFTTSGCIKI